MTKRLFLLLLLIAAVLIACGGGQEEETPTPAAEESVTIRFATYSWEQARYQELVDTFNRDNADIQVKPVSIEAILDLDNPGSEWPEDGWVRLASAADVIQVAASPDAVAAGLVTDLTPLVDADAGLQLDDFYPGTLASCQWDGGTWCLPAAVNLQLIFFDKDAFDAADVPYPEPDWTWDDLLATASALTERQGGEVTRWGLVLDWPHHQAFIESGVGPLLDMTTEPPTPRFDRPEVMQAVAWYVDLVLQHQVVPNLESPALMDTYIQGQKAAMWPSTYLDWYYLTRDQGRNLGAVPFPRGRDEWGGGDASTHIWGRIPALISAGTAHPEAAWRWLNTLGQQTDRVYGSIWLPARRPVAEASGFWDSADVDLVHALRYAVDHSRGLNWFLAGDQWLPFYRPFADAVESVLNDEASVEAALAEVQAQAESEIEETVAGLEEVTPVPSIMVATEEAAQPGADAVTITYLPSSTTTAYRPAVLEKLAGEFQQIHPDIVVELALPGRYTAEEWSIKNLATDADCFSFLPQFLEADSVDAILSLEPFLEADTSVDVDDFYPSLVAQFKWQGQLWALPGEARPIVLKYNKGLFDEAGVDYPALDWTMDEFLETAVALTRGEGEEKQYGFVAAPFEGEEMMVMLQRLGADLFDDSLDPPTMALDDTSTVEALRWYTNLSTEYGAKPVFITDLSQMEEEMASAFMEWSRLIAEGRAGMWTVLEGWDFFDDPDGLEVGMAPLPGGPNHAAGAYRYVEGYFISARSEETAVRRACWEWITFLTEQPEVALVLPARLSVVASEAYRQRVGPDRAGAYAASVAGTGRAPSIAFTSMPEWMSVGMLWLNQAYGQAASGEISVEEALDAAQQAFDAYRACLVDNDAFSDREIWGDCAREADPALPDAFLN